MTGIGLRRLLKDEAVSAPDIQLSGLSADSGWLAPGWAFAACSGSRQHGLSFVDEALRHKPAVVLWEPVADMDPAAALRSCAEAGVPALAVSGLRYRLGQLAAQVWGQPSVNGITVHGVTGTDGKTSVSQFLAQALDPVGGCGLIGTLGHGRPGACQPLAHTTPDAARLQALLAGFRHDGLAHVAMEVSSHALDQRRVDAIRFHSAILTNLGHDHLDYHGDIAAYAAAKRRLFKMPDLALAILNRDDGFSLDLREALAADVRVVDYGWERPACDAASLWCDAYDVHERGCSIELATTAGKLALELPLLGRFNVWNVMAVAALLQGLDWSGSAIRDALQRLQPIPGRMEPFRKAGEPLVVVDYAHTPGALEAALSSLRAHAQRQLICVFGCGGERDRGKRARMGAIAARLADRVVVTDDNPRNEPPQRIVDDILVGLRDAPVRIIRDRRTAIADALTMADPADIILLAGKGHEDYQIDASGRRAYSDRSTVMELLGM